MFEGIDIPRVDTRPTVRTLRRRLCKVALQHYRGEATYNDFLAAARHLAARLEEQ